MRLVLAVIAAVGVTPAMAEPALWVVQGSSSTVYLFGTMHILPKKVAWFTPRIKAAFDRSSALWEEADVGLADPSKMQSLMLQGLAPDSDIFALLPASYSAMLKGQLAKCGMPDFMVAHLKPWLAAMMPTVCALMGADHADPGSMLGPEGTLLEAATKAGKEKAFFETAEEQIGYLSGGSAHSQLVQLEQAIDEAAGDEKSELGKMEDAWLNGDETGMRVEIDKLQKTDTETYQTIFVKRNRKFADGIAGMVRGGKSVFVAVGAGHLIGPDSVVAMLGRMGLSVKRM